MFIRQLGPSEVHVPFASHHLAWSRATRRGLSDLGLRGVAHCALSGLGISSTGHYWHKICPGEIEAADGGQVCET